MRYLFSHWNEVLKKLKSAKHRLLLFDFDGTLAGLTPTPEQAYLEPAMRHLLEKLVRRKSSSVGIISGRSLKEIKNRIGLPGMTYIGNHGFEFQNGHGPWVHPLAKKKQTALHSLSHQLRHVLRPIFGVLIEDKGVTLSIHYRAVKLGLHDRVRRDVRQVLGARRFRDDFQLRQGNHVLEILPRVNWGKGTAVQILRRRSPANTVLFYAGDDRTDEEAFRAVRSQGIAVRIGPLKNSKAPYYLHSQNEMRPLLERLADL